MMIARHHLRSLESKGSAMLYVPLRYDHLLLLTCKWWIWFFCGLLTILGLFILCRVTSAYSLVGCVSFTALPFLIYLILSFFQEKCEYPLYLTLVYLFFLCHTLLVCTENEFWGKRFPLCTWLLMNHLKIMISRWVVIVPTGSRNPSKPFKLELVVYASLQVRWSFISGCFTF